MIKALASKIFGSHSQRELKRIEPLADAVLALEREYNALTHEALRAKTAGFRERLANGETLDDLLIEALATVREGAARIMSKTAFRVQIIGAIVLHQGRIAEMKTGEGKTLTAILAAYLNALAGNGVHIVTVNDYLATFQGEDYGRVLKFLGLTVGIIKHGLDPAERRAAYNADVTYATNNELGFDYLRDNMAIYQNDLVQRGHAFAIVDEVDSILVDEARTPLIISGQGDKSTDLYTQADRFARGLKVTKVVQLESKEEHDDIEGDYVVDEKAKTATLTAEGIQKAERYFKLEQLTDADNTTLVHHINQALKARGTMQRDVDYVVRDGEVIIVDEFTGRLMYGRRYSEGLHQAIEAKENVKVERESKTLATITFQNFFRLYRKLAGMTGTALTEEQEFGEIYKLDIIEIPTNMPMIREDHSDAVYKSVSGKYRAVISQIKECQARGQPVLVGTISIENSELLSSLLRKEGVRHNVLNAKHHEREAEIVAQAGTIGAVTISTNMAGRGTDILLGGNPEFLAKAELKAADPEGEITDEQLAEATARHKTVTDTDHDAVCEAGGLFIIGTERHESRRIDNQLRGRAGRQGDPGESRFFISLEDDLMRLFGASRVTGMLERLGLDEDTAIDQKILSNAIENAQKRVESRNFQVRKTVLEYDDVMNKQREIIYGQRKRVLNGDDMHGFIEGMFREVIERAVKETLGDQKYVDPWQAEPLVSRFQGIFLPPNAYPLTREWCEGKEPRWFTADLIERAGAAYAKREAELTAPILREVERVVLLRSVDSKWMDHIDAMHELRRGIGLRAYSQQDPVVSYKHEGFEMFDDMINAIREDTVRMIFTVRVQGQNAPERERIMRPVIAGTGDGPVRKEPVKKGKKVGRNDPCPCGSGKKFKMCCGNM
jgi:preprotein translocase subunit SecA